MRFTNDELILVSLYNTGDRSGTINEITEMYHELCPDENDIRDLAESALLKLHLISDEEFDKLDIVPDGGSGS